MNFRREQTKDYYLFDTEVENIFINEYLISAPGDYVKVYLFSLMYADLGQEMDDETIAKHLGLKKRDVQEAWSYWESQGVVKKYRENLKDKDHYKVEFVNLKERLYGKIAKSPTQSTAEKTGQITADEDLQAMYNTIEKVTGKTLSGSDVIEIFSWVNDFHAPPEIVVYAYSYCKTKNKANIRYVAEVLRNWVSKGFTSIEAVEEYLQNVDERRYLYKRVCKALGFVRNATEKEKEIMDTWFDQMEFSIGKVLEACGKTSGIPNPNINYVNKVLSNWYEEQTGKSVSGEPKPASITTVRKYYDHLRKTAEQEAEKRKKEVYRAIPKLLEIEEEINSGRKDVSKLIISDRVDKKSEIKKLQEKNNRLNEERAELLIGNKFEQDVLDIKYKCDLCKDTGTNDKGERCKCFPQRTQEAQTWAKSLK